MNLYNTYEVKKVFNEKNYVRLIDVEVPGSKSITNRALLLASLSTGKTRLSGVLFSSDTSDMISALNSLGIKIKTDEKRGVIVVEGCAGNFPTKSGNINVGNAGTVARFITALLALSGGIYRLDALSQMKKRPMKPLLDALKCLNVTVKYEEKEGYFPFTLDSRFVTGNEITLDTSISTQFLSAVLMTAPLLKNGLTVNIVGSRERLPYVDMTVNIMKEFGITPTESIGRYTIKGGCNYSLKEYAIEPDVSAACYFYGMAILLGCKTLVRGIHLTSLQGDIAFIRLLEKMGGRLTDTSNGILLEGVKNGIYNGVDIDMNAFSDQALTLAALSVFAKSATTIKGLGHIRLQESDRLKVIATELSRVGASCTMGEDYIIINPTDNFPKTLEIETYNDHRVAMAFSLIGLRKSGITIKNPDCSAKTFKNYFNILDRIVTDFS